MLSLNKDELSLIAIKLDLEDLKNFYCSNKELYRKIDNNNLWIQKIKRDFPKNNLEIKDGKNVYKLYIKLVSLQRELSLGTGYIGDIYTLLEEKSLDLYHLENEVFEKCEDINILFNLQEIIVDYHYFFGKNIKISKNIKIRYKVVDLYVGFYILDYNDNESQGVTMLYDDKIYSKVNWKDGYIVSVFHGYMYSNMDKNLKSYSFSKTEQNQAYQIIPGGITCTYKIYSVIKN
jgi:hypothetical protein